MHFTRIIAAALALSAAGIWLAVGMGETGAPRPEPIKAVGATQDLPEAFKRALEPDGFKVLGPPGPHDWLANHPEPGQTYDQFVAGRFNAVGPKRNKIYLQPIGAFDPGVSPKLSNLETCAAGFFGLEVAVLEPLDPKQGKLTTRTNPNTHNHQVLATDVLTWLEKQLPEDAYCLLGVTMLDLYPEPSWNFVFGMASIRDRVGVFSFARYDPAFYGEKRGADQQQVLLRRSCKVLTHETGHMFGLYHCIHYECGMNGSNHLAESDSRPIHLCPVCLRKLHRAVGFDVVERYRKLLAFYGGVDLDTEANWVKSRLAKIAR